MNATAIFSECRTFRYRLSRHWGGDGYLNFLMLNPSTADENTNDPTIERCQRRAMALGYSGLVVTNLFAFRSTDPLGLHTVKDPIGPANDAHILAVARNADVVVAGWGKHGGYYGRDFEVKQLLRDGGVSLHALRLNSDRSPEHPLYIPYDLPPVLLADAPLRPARKKKAIA